MVTHPGKPIPIYIAELAGSEYPRTFNPENIVSGFKVADILPYDRNVFSDSDFLSYVIDRLSPSVHSSARERTSQITY